jgi:peptidoglycan/LPS O-acetylase OafA/YrhL
MDREIRPLTGIRGIAACWVVACHWSGEELTGLARDVALHGYAAVDLFMILSGFVLAMTYVPRTRTPWRYFVRQRFCRLYPLYALTTLVCLAEARATGTGLFAPGGGPVVPAVISNMLMTTTHLWEVDAILTAMLAMAPFKAMDLPFAAACCLLVIGLAAERSRIAALPGSPSLHWLGTISFSLYLWHAAFLPLRPMLLRVLPTTSPAAALIAANTISLAIVLEVSSLSYHWFEVPLRRWLRGRFAVPA